MMKTWSALMFAFFLSISAINLSAAVEGPIHLGKSSIPATLHLGLSNPVPAELAGERWYPYWPENYRSWQPPSGSWNADPLSLEAYHIPAIVEFLKPGYVPEGINYSSYVPALGEFAGRGEASPADSYSLHAPAIGAFLSEEWQPQSPDAAYYPPWMIEYLQG